MKRMGKKKKKSVKVAPVNFVLSVHSSSNYCLNSEQFFFFLNCSLLTEAMVLGILDGN
jgi:hypothetical protein